LLLAKLLRPENVSHSQWRHSLTVAASSGKGKTAPLFLLSMYFIKISYLLNPGNAGVNDSYTYIYIYIYTYTQRDPIIKSGIVVYKTHKSRTFFVLRSRRNRKLYYRHHHITIILTRRGVATGVGILYIHCIRQWAYRVIYSRRQRHTSAFPWLMAKTNFVPDTEQRNRLFTVEKARFGLVCFRNLVNERRGERVRDIHKEYGKKESG